MSPHEGERSWFWTQFRMMVGQFEDSCEKIQVVQLVGDTLPHVVFKIICTWC